MNGYGPPPGPAFAPGVPGSNMSGVGPGGVPMVQQNPGHSVRLFRPLG